MLDTILQEIREKVKNTLPSLIGNLEETLRLEEFERSLRSLTQEITGTVMGPVLNQVLHDESLLKRLREAAGTMGYKYKAHRPLTVRVLDGVEVAVQSPYFTKKGRKRGKKKRGPNGRGCHLLLEVLGFIGQSSPTLVEEGVQLALLCPSFEVARQMLDARQITLDKKTLRRLCNALGELGLEQRATVGLEADPDLTGKTLYVGIDGGRLRTRVAKRGPIPEGKKRAGFTTPWREPKLFTLYTLDENGRTDLEWCPFHDATLGDADAVFALLEATLRQLPLDQIERIVFLGDGAEWIWPRVGQLIWKLGFPPDKAVQILDYYHNIETLWEVVQLQPKRSPKQQRACFKKWKSLLWEGNRDQLRQEVLPALRGKKRKQALNALIHFEKHAERMRYPYFKQQGLPIGSGHVESAIRRVINLRLKAPGTFWKEENAEYFLFLRSQLISGRWSIFFHNVTRRYHSGTFAQYLFPASEKNTHPKTGTDHP